MAISTYSELQTAIANWINDDNLGTVIPDFIKLAEARIATDFKSQHLVSVTNITVDAASEALPSNNKGIISAHLNTNPKQVLDYMPPDEFDSRYGSNETGKPLAYTIKGQTIYFLPSPDSTYTCVLSHYATPNIETDLTNSLLTNFPNLYLFASLAEAAIYVDEDPSRWEVKYNQALDAAMDEDRLVGALAIQLDNVP